MCGIVGYIGSQQAIGFLIEGLRRLEYRGYDSSGVVTIDHGEFQITKSAGRVDELVEKLKTKPAHGSIGLGHTRWATHGPATDVNAHPHIGGDGVVAVVHNGVIENFRELKQQLAERGYYCKTATDTEVVAHLVASELDARTPAAKAASPADKYTVLVEAVQAALAQLRGTYGLAMVFRDWPDVIVAARLGSPLVLGVGDGEHFIASDGSPLVGHTERIVYLADNELAVVTADSIRVIHRDEGDVRHNVKQLDIDTTQVDLGEYPHYMLKEIFEQPETVLAAMRGRLNRDEATAVFGGLNLTPQQLRSIDRIVLTACGTSWHSALVGEYIIEAYARIPVEVEYASELRYRNPPMSNNTVLFAITQSGETIDTLAALREMKRKGHTTLAICNVVGSTIAREADGGIYLHAGPEIGVASTKAFTSQCVVMALLALYFGRLRHLSFEAGLRIIEELSALPKHVEEALETNDETRRIAAKYASCNNFLYLGRQYNFPAALEGALKLKEISYIHAEGYPAAEMKHGPIALVDEQTPSVFIVPQGGVYSKVISNMEEIKARGGPVIAVVDKDDSQAVELADEVIRVPAVPEFLQPIVAAIPLQLLAYHAAILRGCDVDKPRNLAKSVTVEQTNMPNAQNISSVLDQLTHGPEIVRQLIYEMPPELRKRRPAPGMWSAHEHAVHLPAVQPIMMRRLDQMLAQPGCTIKSYEPSRDDPDDVLLKLDLDAEMNRFDRERAAMVERLRTLTPAEWAITADHEEYAHYSVFIMFRHIALHDLHHAYKIEERLLRKDWS